MRYRFRWYLRARWFCEAHVRGYQEKRRRHRQDDDAEATDRWLELPDVVENLIDQPDMHTIRAICHGDAAADVLVKFLCDTPDCTEFPRRLADWYVADWRAETEDCNSIGRLHANTEMLFPEFITERSRRLARIRVNGGRQYTFDPGKEGGNFYESREWRSVRYHALVLHGARCQCCGAARGNGRVMHVDHIKPRSKYPELELSLENLQVLCDECNLGKSNKDQTDWRPEIVEPRRRRASKKKRARP